MPYWSVIGLDCMLVLLAGFLTYLILHGAAETARVFVSLVWSLIICMFCYLVGFRIFHTYQGVIRYSSFSDLLRISCAAISAVILVFIVQLILAPANYLIVLAAADIIVTGLFVITFMWMVRLWVKTLYEITQKHPGRIGVFIVGVREGGIALAKNIRSSIDMPYEVKGFVSDDTHLKQHRLMGMQVFPFNDDLINVMKGKDVRTLIVSPMMMESLRDKGELVDRLLMAGCKILVMPKAREWSSKTDLNVTEFKPVDVEDLLPRQKIEVDMQAAADMLRDNVVLITGASGSIGSEIVRQVASYKPRNLVLIDQAETPMHDIRLMMKNQFGDIPTETIVSDIADKRIMERIFSTYRPRYVFHAAAYKHVPMMEDNPYEAIINNVNGTKIIADLAVKYGAEKFVMVSTDKAVNPTNVMGCSKRICEIYVQSLDKAIKDGKVQGRTQFVTTRFGNVLGSNGSVIPIFQEQIRNGGPVTVTHPDIIRFFMLIPEACRLVIEAGTMGKGGEIYVFDMGEPVRIADLAKRMIKLSGATNVEIKYTGLRDGEKLYEEVLNDKEVTVPTFHPKIKIAKVREYEFVVIDREITDMVAAAESEDDMQIVARMKAMVPEFRSQHSKYEALDKPEIKNS